MTDQNHPVPPAGHPAESGAPREAAPATPGAPRRRWTRFITPALALVAALIVGGVVGGIIGHSTATAAPQRPGFGQGGFPGGGQGFGGGQGGSGGGAGQNGGGARPGAAGPGGFTAGTISSIDGDTITLKLQDGSTVKVSTSDSTRVTQTSTSSVSKLKKGDTITVIGQRDSSGDVSATNIAEGASGLGGFRGGFGGGRGGTPQSGSN